MKVKKILSVCVLSFTGFACSSLNTVSLTQIPSDRSNVVDASVSKWIILGANFNNNYIEPLTVQLKEKCQDGEVKGILTKDEVINDFLFWHKRKVTATGYCV